MVIQNKKLRVQNPCGTEDKLCQIDNTLPAVLNSNAKLKSKSALLKYNSKIHCYSAVESSQGSSIMHCYSVAV